MNSFRKSALLGLLVTGAAFTSISPAVAKDKDKAAAAPAGPKYNLSKPVQEALVKSQDAIAKQDWATANAQLAIADAALSTDDDRYLSAVQHVQVAQATKDTAAELKALNYLNTSPRTTDEQKKEFLGVAAQIDAMNKDTAAEQAARQQLLALDPNNTNNLLSIADMYNNQKNYAQALAMTQKAVDIMRAANQPIDPAVSHNLFAYAYNSHDTAAVAKYGPMLVSGDPSPDNWKLVIDVLRQQPGLDDQSRLDLYRLMRVTGGFEDGGDYISYADLATHHGLPGEAVAALDLAQTKGVRLNPADASSIRAATTPKIAADKASLGAAETAARAAATGRQAMGVADGYLSYDQWQKAADLYALALQKGGVDPATVQMRRGIALAHLGQKAEAKAAFAQVTGPRAAMAGYWSIWADHAG